MTSSIWWIRRDLRLQDNPALNAAQHRGQPILPVFILDPHLLSRPASRRQAFLFDGLRQLDKSLQALGSRLIVRQGHPEQVLLRLLAESNSALIFAQEDFSPYARRRDTRVGAALPLELVNGQTIHHPAAVVKHTGAPYAVFSAFKKAWQALPAPGKPLPAPLARFLPVPPLDSLPIPDMPALPDFPAGEAEAQKRLAAFLRGPIYCYVEDRQRLDLDSSAALSPYIRFGMLSARQAATSAFELAMRSQTPENRTACLAWVDELIWRDFFSSILYHFPQVLTQPFNPAYLGLAWRQDPLQLAAWQEGRTGYPIVDACMRQLASTGWIHNRGRMIVASFLVKDLLLDWRLGERWFMRHLVDGDPAANNGGWQWSAGVGADAAPYFRIFNPVSQGQKCDPQGIYIRRWLPELGQVPLEYIHRPWQMPDELQRQAGCRIGCDYPVPIVDHVFARQRAIMAYTKAYRRKSRLGEKSLDS